MKKHTILSQILLIALSFGLLKADETKWIVVGQLHDWFSDGGSEIEVGRRHEIPDQQDGLQWPAQFQYQDVKAAKALWIGTTNYTDPISGQTYGAKVVHVGPRVLDELNEFMPQEFRLFARYDHPKVYVDGLPASDMELLDLVTDDPDDQLPSDRLLINKVNTSIGITMTRKIYAYSRRGYDNFYIYVYTFKNTGVYDLDGNTQSTTLEDVTFFWQERYAMTKEACAYGYYWMPQNATWGRNTMNEVIGENAEYGSGYSDPYRATYSWCGLHSGWGGPGDCIGSPAWEKDGHLGASQFVGIMTIHADKNPDDPNDDPYQPFSTPFPDSDDPLNSGNDQFNTTKMASEYVLMTSGHPSNSHAEEVGSGYADQYGATGGGYSQGRGYGPYTMAPGDSIVIVTVEAVAGLSRKMDYSVGAQWLANPSGYNATKDALVLTGKDSLFQTFQRAQSVWNNDLQIEHEPPPPDQFMVTSGGDRISLDWTSSAESWPNFAGYRVYRALSTPDTTFDLIAELGPGETHYEDRAAIRGFDYYYYLTTVDNGSTNDLHTGQPMESSLFYTRTNEPAYLRRPPGEKMSDIRVVPNPYDIRSRQLQYGTSSLKDRIMFLNIPAECTIRIFTERGDLVNTIEHRDGSGDEAWNLVTSSRQIVVSGVYIAHFETPNGDSHIEKFVVIR